MKNLPTKLLTITLIFTAALGGYIAGEHPKHCQQVVMRDIAAHQLFAAQLSKQVNPDFLTAMGR